MEADVKLQEILYLVVVLLYKNKFYLSEFLLAADNNDQSQNIY